MPSPLVWCYVPTDQCNEWEPPYVCETECPTLADAHHHARVLRQHYPGHLFAVTDGREPLRTR